MSYTKKQKEDLRYRKFQLKITDKMVAERLGCTREWVTRVKNGVDNDDVFKMIKTIIKEVEQNQFKTK